MLRKRSRKDYDFKAQLADGVKYERRVQRLLSGMDGKTFEVKSEGKRWHRTGNIAIEYESHGEPSGIAATKADYWIHELRSQEGETLAYLMFPTPILRKVCNDLMDESQGRFKKHWRRGGEGEKMEMILVKLSELFGHLQDFAGKGDKAFLTRKQRQKSKSRLISWTRKIKS